MISARIPSADTRQHNLSPVAEARPRTPRVGPPLTHLKPAWWDEIGHGSRCPLCEVIGRRHKGKVYDYRNSPDPRKRAHGVTCNRCGRLDQPKRTPKVRNLRRVDKDMVDEINPLYPSIIQSARCSDPEVQALIRGSTGQLSARYVRNALGGRFATADARLQAGIKEIPGFMLRPGHPGEHGRSRQLVIDLNFLNRAHLRYAQRQLSRRRVTMARARNQALGTDGASVSVLTQAIPEQVTVDDQIGIVPVSVRAASPQTGRVTGADRDVDDPAGGITGPPIRTVAEREAAEEVEFQRKFGAQLARIEAGYGLCWTCHVYHDHADNGGCAHADVGSL